MDDESENLEQKIREKIRNCIYIIIILFILYFILYVVFNCQTHPLMIYVWVLMIGFFVESMIIWKRKYHTDKKYVKKDIKCAWEIFKTLDKLVHDRINYFLIAESMLLFSFVSSLSYDIRKNIDIFPEQRYLTVVISIVGVLITSIWYFNVRRIRIRMNFLQKILEEDKIWKGYTESVKRLAPSGQFMLTSLMPLIILLFWIYILFFSSNYYSMSYVIDILMPIMILILIGIRAIIEIFLPELPET